MVNTITKSALATLISAALSTTVQAAGFALANQSGSGAGNAYSGSAVAVDDASVVWFNPAGMTALAAGTHTSAAGHLIAPKADFTDKASRVNPALTGGNLDVAATTLTGTNADGGNPALVPNAYVVRSYGDKLSAGIGVNAPFGLGTEYDEDWIGRYNALESSIQTVNVNPAIAYQVNDKLSVGAGVSAQYLHVELQTAIDSAAACRSIASAANSGALLTQCLARLPALSNAATDSKATISGDDISFGVNAGVLYQATPATRVGASYRSALDHELEGEVEYDIDPSLQPIVTATGITRFNTADATAEANLPASLSVSAAHKVNARLEVMGDVTRTNWSSFESLTVKKVADGSLVTDTRQDWEDVNRYALGANYQYNDRLKVRGGVAFDETPVPSPQLRTPRTPDTDRTWVSAGANYKLKKNMDVDVGYTHIFMDETPIDNVNPDNGYAIRGLYDSSVDIVSAQLNWSF
ncbi:OmpP1/FadL family transporter [Thiothrix subterranea]|uniref:OmpP1/FadL family transporter n=1 Tax=Thiothrix subterranea TaxID=2735563 RepID=A0AA51R5R1_9GAMM|nr:OmpP1/FadL family transporter [Thiothrix subterranea]MDQ5767201.1 OmpP1/FadL family transporter [Thiothrix subterranea]WML87936.1 OmpP1/FadL family transporter [Thiothrix subterranea]